MMTILKTLKPITFFITYDINYHEILKLLAYLLQLLILLCLLFGNYYK